MDAPANDHPTALMNPHTTMNTTTSTTATTTTITSAATATAAATTTTDANTAAQDPLDNALANQQTRDYDSSDLDLSSSDEDSSSDEEENDRDAKDDGDEDDEENDQGGQTVPKSKNEVTDIAIDTPIVKEITADMQVDTIGTIVNVMDKTVVVQQRAGCSTVLDMGSLLVFAQDRQVLGEVFETFGPVELPFYSVRFNTVDEIDIERTVKGAPIGYVPAYERTQLVQVEQLKLMKGTDASNQYDEEAGVDELEFSDDEKEMEYRRKSKKKGKQGQTKQQQQRVQKRPLEDAAVPDGRRPLQSYADIMTTSTSIDKQPQPTQRRHPSGMTTNRLPPPPQQQHPDAMTALLDSYMTSQPPATNTRTPQQLPRVQPQTPQQQPKVQEQPPQQQPQQPPQQQAPSNSIFQSIRSLFSRAPPPA